MYMYKQALVLNNQQWLIRHKTQPDQIKSPWVDMKDRLTNHC